MGYQTSGTKLPTDTSTSWAHYLDENADLIGGKKFKWAYLCGFLLVC
jgi:hypothetical protein